MKLFLQEFGFESDPFASTNAADEPLIQDYFVDPPFFASVSGDPKNPKSTLIFAPRGGGKTAQKIMLEKFSAETQEFLCVTYDKFITGQKTKLGDIDADFHLNNINRILLITCLILISENSYYEPTKSEKDLIVQLSRLHLDSIGKEEMKNILNSIKSLGHRADDIWIKYGSGIRALFNAIAARFDVGKIEDLQIQSTTESPRYVFEQLCRIARSLSDTSVYILVDRVDENPLTSADAEKSFLFLKDVLLDLNLLEMEGTAFKMFLWDGVRQFYDENGGRPDRIPQFALEWSVNDLDSILSKRLNAHSNSKVSRFDHMVAPGYKLDAHKLISYFSHGSPRDSIRICKSIIDEHVKHGDNNSKIQPRTIHRAIVNFSSTRAQELYKSHHTEIKKIGDINFSINYIASEIFRISQQAGRAKIQKWLASGAVRQIGSIPNPGGRPHYNYGIVDPRLALAVLGDTDIENALSDYMIACPGCSKVRLAYDGDITCPDCSETFDARTAETLYQICRKL